MNTSKLIELIKILPKRPVEVWDRVATVIEVKKDQRQRFEGRYDPIDWDVLLEDLADIFPGRINTIIGEPELQAVEASVLDQQRALRTRAPWTITTDGDLVLGRVCYMLTRATRPTTVLETGVAYGVTSSFILQALEVNGYGTLHSIDLPPLGKNADDFVGNLIPDHLRKQWHLHRGPSKRILPPLLNQIGNIDFFVHDSLHTYKTMRYELETVEPRLSPGAVIVADDIQDNRAFLEWCTRRPARLTRAVKESSKDAMLGIRVMLGTRVGME